MVKLNPTEVPEKRIEVATLVFTQERLNRLLENPKSYNDIHRVLPHIIQYVESVIELHQIAVERAPEDAKEAFHQTAPLKLDGEDLEEEKKEEEVVQEVSTIPTP